MPKRFYVSNNQSRMPRRTRRHPCVNDTTICAHFHRYLTGTKHLILAMLCPMLIFLLFYLDAMRFCPQTWLTSVRSHSMPFPSHLLCWLYAILRSAFAQIAVFSYVVRSFYTRCLIFLVSLSILYMHVTHITTILSSRRPECPFQF